MVTDASPKILQDPLEIITFTPNVDQSESIEKIHGYILYKCELTRIEPIGLSHGVSNF